VAVEQGIDLLVRLPRAKQGVVFLPRRWVIDRDFGLMSRFRRLARDQEAVVEMRKGFPLVAFAMLMFQQVRPVRGVR
jgi:hypothetical protein